MGSVNAIPFSLPYKGEMVLVKDISTIKNCHWHVGSEIRQRIRESRSAIDENLGSRISLIHNSRTKFLPDACDQKTHIFIACLKTALHISLVAATVFSGLYLGASAFILSTAVLVFESVALYVLAQVEYDFPERRIQSGEPVGPWFCPNLETTKGKIAALSMIWPVISGVFLPLLEASTRKSRWENVLEKQNEQLADNIPKYCEFYKEHADALFDKLKVKISHGPSVRNLDSTESWETALEYLNAQLEFLKNFDPEVPSPKSIAELS